MISCTYLLHYSCHLECIVSRKYGRQGFALVLFIYLHTYSCYLERRVSRKSRWQRFAFGRLRSFASLFMSLKMQYFKTIWTIRLFCLGQNRIVQIASNCLGCWFLTGAQVLVLFQILPRTVLLTYIIIYAICNAVFQDNLNDKVFPWARSLLHRWFQDNLNDEVFHWARSLLHRWFQDNLNGNIFPWARSLLHRWSGSWSKGFRFESRLERRENFLLQGQPSALTLSSVSVPPRVTAVARKRSRSFCPKCR